MMMGTDWGMGWGGMWFGWLLMIGFTVAVVVLVAWLFRLSAPGSSTGSVTPRSGGESRSALDMLQERYARGEISKDEYLDARATLRS